MDSYVCKCVHVYISSGITRLKDRSVCTILYMHFHAYVRACAPYEFTYQEFERLDSVRDVGLTWVPERVYWICSCSLWLRLGRNSEAPQIGKYALIHSQLHTVTLPVSVWMYLLVALCMFFMFTKFLFQESKQDQAVGKKVRKFETLYFERDETIKSIVKTAREKEKNHTNSF